MARDINKAIIVGRLGDVPEKRLTQAGQAVAQFSVATNNRWTDAGGDKHDEVAWHRVVVWGKLADVAAEYLRKGSRIYVEGRLQYRKWKDQDGQDRYTTEIIASELVFLDAAPAPEPHTNGKSAPVAATASF